MVDKAPSSITQPLIKTFNKVKKAIASIGAVAGVVKTIVAGAHALMKSWKIL